MKLRMLAVIRKVFSKALLMLFRVDVHGVQAQKGEGATILIANHVSFLDGVLVSLASTTPLVVPVETHYAIKFWPSRCLFRFLEMAGYGKVIALDSNSPSGLRSIKRLLDSGQSVLIFPEGKISHDGRLQPFMPGAEWLIRRTGAKTRAVHIHGAEQSLLFAKSGRSLWPKITLCFCTDLAEHYDELVLQTVPT